MILDQHGAYSVPCYRAPDEGAWFHFLHGNVPGHQIDFMYRAEVPQGRLTRQHFSHLSRLMKYIEPRTNAPHAFAIGNLSRDDTQHEPGHGGLALIFGLRIRGATDHAGRQDPPFSHGIAVIDRELSAEAIHAASKSFHRHVFGAAESAEWYRAYVRCALESPSEVPRVLAGYVASFDDMPRPSESRGGTRWLAGSASPPKRVVIAHPDDASFDAIARCAARIAAMLYPSDIRWTAISSGREADVPNGVSVRFVAESALTASDEELGPRWLDDVPEEEGEIAYQLFGATGAMKAKRVALGWRERYSVTVDPPSEGGGERPSYEGYAPPPPRLRSERPIANLPPPPQAEPAPPRARESGEVEPDWESLPADDLDAKTEAFVPWRSEPSAAVEGRASIDDEAVTVGAPMQRSPTLQPENDVDVSPSEDEGERRASFELPRAPALAAPNKDAQVTVTAAFQRETVQLSPAEIQRTLAEALPFRAAPSPPLASSPPAPTSEDHSWSPDDIPDFRSAPFSGWKWVAMIAVAALAILAVLYFAFADPPPAPAATPATSQPTSSAAVTSVPIASVPIASAPIAPTAAPAASATQVANAAPLRGSSKSNGKAAKPTSPPTPPKPPPGAFDITKTPKLD